MLVKKMKRDVKRLLTFFLTTSDQKAKDMLETSQVISFDIFDTLVKRNVRQPEDIHEIVGARFYEQTGIEIKSYKKIRCHAETLARKRKKEEEICLKDIFDQMKEIPKEQKDLLQNLEETIEIENATPDKGMQRIYAKAVESQKHIIITSDMYLNRTVIERILDKCGYTGYEKLYLSSEYKVCKSSGNLYDMIKQDYAEKWDKILHIGDNVKGDYIVPIRKGIKAQLINGNKNKVIYWGKCSSKCSDFVLYKRLSAFINNHIDENCSPEERIGYEILGPMLYGYIMWLHKRLIEEGIEKVFFLSREGKLLKETYEILFPDSGISCQYLYVSRQALLVPLLAQAKNLDDMAHTLKCFLRPAYLETIRAICDIEPHFFASKLREIGLEEKMKLHEISEEKKQAVFDIIMQSKEQEFIEQRQLIERYFARSGLQGKIAISDVGWIGTMQGAIHRYTQNQQTEIYGYYFGYRNYDEDKKDSYLKRDGYLFSPYENKERRLSVRFTSCIFEYLFMNSEGSVHKYKDGQDIIPVLYKSEYTYGENQRNEKLQKSAICFVKQARQELNLKEIPADIAFIPYRKWAVYPSMKTIRFFEDSSFLNGINKRILPTHRILYYIIHPKQFVNEMNNSDCKLFFLKKICRLRLPYLMMLKWMLQLGIHSEFQREYLRSGRADA